MVCGLWFVVCGCVVVWLCGLWLCGCVVVWLCGCVVVVVVVVVAVAVAVAVGVGVGVGVAGGVAAGGGGGGGGGGCGRRRRRQIGFVSIFYLAARFGYWFLDFGVWISDFGLRILDCVFFSKLWILHEIYVEHPDSFPETNAFDNLTVVSTRTTDSS